MPPTILNSTSFTNYTVGVATDSFTVSAGSNRTLVVVCGTPKGAGAGFSTMTYGGVSLTKRREGLTTADGQVWAIFTLDSPTAGTANLVTTHTNPVTSFGFRIAQVVQDTGGYGSYVDTDTASATTTIDITSATNRLVLGYGLGRGTTSITDGAGQTFTVDTTGTVPRSRGSTEAGSATVTTSYTFSGGSAYTVIAVDMLDVTAASSIAAISSGFHVRNINR